MKNKTKHEISEIKKKEANESEEYLKQVEKPDSQGGGRKFVQDTLKEEETKKQKEIDTVMTNLQAEQQRHFSYRRHLAEHLNKEIEKLDLGENYQALCLPTDGTPITIHNRKYKTEQGILMILRSPNGNVYVRGMHTIYSADIDSKASYVLLTQLENTVDELKGLLIHKPKTGLIDSNGRPI